MKGKRRACSERGSEVSWRGKRWGRKRGKVEVVQWWKEAVSEPSRLVESGRTLGGIHGGDGGLTPEAETPC